MFSIQMFLEYIYMQYGYVIYMQYCAKVLGHH